MVRCAVPRVDLEHLWRWPDCWDSGVPAWRWLSNNLRPKVREPHAGFYLHHVASNMPDALVCILNSVSHNNTVCTCWVNWVYLTWATAPRCDFSQVSLPTCATCSRTDGWKGDSWRDWSCNIDSGCWGHLGQFISAKQIIRLPRGKPKTQRWEGMDQIYTPVEAPPLKCWARRRLWRWNILQLENGNQWSCILKILS